MNVACIQSSRFLFHNIPLDYEEELFCHWNGFEGQVPAYMLSCYRWWSQLCMDAASKSYLWKFCYSWIIISPKCSRSVSGPVHSRLWVSWLLQWSWRFRLIYLRSWSLYDNLFHTKNCLTSKSFAMRKVWSRGVTTMAIFALLAPHLVTYMFLFYHCVEA